MDIATLIKTARGSRSYERLAIDCDGELTKGRLHQIATSTPFPPKEFPEPATVRALAHGLRVSERVVVLAWAETLGLDVGTDETRLALLLPPSSASLTDEQIAAVLAVIRSMTSTKEREDDGQSATTKKAGENPAAEVEVRVVRRVKHVRSEPRTGSSQRSGSESPGQNQP